MLNTVDFPRSQKLLRNIDPGVEIDARAMRFSLDDVLKFVRKDATRAAVLERI